LKPERGRELRKSKRTRRRNAAWIALSNGGVRIPCVLWDISDSGARIAAARANALPQVFCLLLSNDGKSRRFCRVVWRKEGQVGIRFIAEDLADIDFDGIARHRRPAPVAAAPAPPPAARARNVTAGELLLPGCGPHVVPRVAVRAEPRGVAFSSVALGIVILLGAAAALFAFADMQSAANAPWALQVCDGARNFCMHPEWVVAASAVMSVVYLAARGMEL
jgi:hypothetical protein